MAALEKHSMALVVFASDNGGERRHVITTIRERGYRTCLVKWLLKTGSRHSPRTALRFLGTRQVWSSFGRSQQAAA